MRGGFLSISGLWYLEEGLASRMESIVRPRLQAGKEPVAAAMFAEHPARNIQAHLATAGLNVMAGTISYFEYVATQYTTGGVCVIPIIGTLSRYGLCSWGYEDLAGLLAVADRMEDIKAIVLRIDSGGGAVDGLRALADAMRLIKKPILVWSNFMASAAYFIGSQATEIWLEDSPLPVIGSVGTLMVYTDQSKALKQQGLEVEIFRATESVDKARVNGIEPLTDELRTEIQAMLDNCQKEFVGFVRRGRAGLLKSDEWTTARMYGTDKGISLGLADKKGTLQQAIKRAAQMAA
ncbi:S49 family peptidase [Spirosoma spitsbergense]|uniref:S49 family peptidase n=1 Tax=Spirosoma spitsbergense TaxID=431554 RepID=UPI00036CACFF|nr:S49 family peptidase [Spirosoma spitsbergense]